MVLIAPERRILWSALATASAFVVVGILVFQLDGVNSLDRAISAWLQSLRRPWLDSVMVMITMAADSRVLTLFAVTVVLVLFSLRAWGLAIFCAVSMLGNVFLVPWLKDLLQRTRPFPLSTGADSYSFPSGHAAMATVVLGTAVIVVASGLSRAARNCAFAGLALVLFAIALSRVYLQVHWTTDVIAGVLLGAVTLLGLLLVLERSELPLPGKLLAVLLLLAYFIAYLGYLFSAFSVISSLYFSFNPD